MPVIGVCGHQVVCFLVGKEIEHKKADRRIVADRFVEDIRIGRCRYAIGLLCEFCHTINHCISKSFYAKLIGEAVYIQECKVCWFTVFEEEFTLLQAAGVEP
jgi:hypothetical protein